MRRYLQSIRHPLRGSCLQRCMLMLATLLCLLASTPISLAAQDPAPEEPVAPLQLEQPADVASRLHLVYENTRESMFQLLLGLPLLLIAIIIVWLAAWIGGLVSRHVRLFRLRSPNPYLDGLIRTGVRTAFILAGLLIALDLLGISTMVGAVLGSAGLMGLIIGFAFKDIAENYISGVLLSLRRPFEPGQHVRIDSYEGRVVAVSSRATMLLTLDGVELRIPNALVFKAVIQNFSHNPRRRFDFSIAIDESESIREAQTLALEKIAAVEGVLAEPGPSWMIVEYTSSAITLRFFGWVNQTESDLGRTRSEALRQVKATFAQAGIISPKTTYHLINDTVTPPTVSIREEPLEDGAADTSVNTDIDEQLLEVQRAHNQVNLLHDEEASK